MNIPRGQRTSGIYTPRVVINTLFNEKECAIVVLLYRIGLITVELAVENLCTVMWATARPHDQRNTKININHWQLTH